MSNATVFEYTVFKTAKEDKDGNVVDPAKILVPTETIIASDEHEVSIRASKAIPDEEMGNLDRIKVAIRPF